MGISVEKWLCELCDGSITYSGRGRRPDYCCEACRRVGTALNNLENYLAKIPFKEGPAGRVQKAAVRGRVWSIANRFNANHKSLTYPEQEVARALEEEKSREG